MIIVPTPVFFPGKEKFEGPEKALNGEWEVKEVKWDPYLKMVILVAKRKVSTEESK